MGRRHLSSRGSPSGRRWRGLALVVAAIVLVGSCSDSEDGAGQPDSKTTVASTVASVPSDGTSSTTAASTTGSAAAGSSTTTAAGSITLAGEEVDAFAQAGDRLMVIGVRHGDTLNLRAGPGTDQPVLATLAPTAIDVEATGKARQLDRSLWYGVRALGADGWISARYLAFGGVVDDVTSDIVTDLGQIPTAQTMLDLGALVAAERTSGDVESDVVLVVGPTAGDLGEVTYDVIGLADDSVLGVRLHVFGQPMPDGEGFSLASVEQTTLCLRGVDPSGACQ